jgi:PTH2 family peptidyl-tRNA hydrolase
MKDLVQYYIVDSELKMRKGKIAAQCAHGAVYFSSSLKFRLSSFIPMKFLNLMEDLSSNYHIENNVLSMKRIKEWGNGLNKKIVLKGNQDIMDKVMLFYPDSIEVIDEGLTDVEKGTRTVVVLPLIDKNKAPLWIKELKTL